jgi:hypothetical protein
MPILFYSLFLQFEMRSKDLKHIDEGSVVLLVLLVVAVVEEFMQYKQFGVGSSDWRCLLILSFCDLKRIVLRSLRKQVIPSIGEEVLLVG